MCVKINSVGTFDEINKNILEEKKRRIAENGVDGSFYYRHLIFVKEPRQCQVNKVQI